MPRVYDIKSRFDLDIIELVRPDGYWPNPYSIEQAFQTFRWMAVTGKDYTKPGRWGSSGVRELLSMSSGVNLSSISGITSIEDLRRRFQYAVLGKGNEAITSWRNDHRVHVGEKVTIPYAVHKPYNFGSSSAPFNSEANIQEELNRMLKPADDQTMKVSLNYVHHWVRNLHGVQIHAGDKGFVFDIWYGTAPKSTGRYSHWNDTLARSREGETFLQTLGRARDNFDLFVHGKVPAKGIDLSDTYWDRGHDPRRDHIEYQLANGFQTPPKADLLENDEPATSPSM